MRLREWDTGRKVADWSAMFLTSCWGDWLWAGCLSCTCQVCRPGSCLYSAGSRCQCPYVCFTCWRPHCLQRTYLEFFPTRFVFSPVYLLNHLYPSGLITALLFAAQIVPASASRHPSLGCCTPFTYPLHSCFLCSFFFLSSFLLPETARCSQLSLYVSCIFAWDNDLGICLLCRYNYK